MTDVFDEVDEDLRNEKLEQWWKKHGQTVVAFAIGIVIGTVIYVFVQDYRASQAEQSTETFAMLVSQTNDVVEKEKALTDLAAFGQDQGGDKGALALLKAAEGYVEIGNAEKATDLYSQVYAMRGINIFYNDLALLMKVQLTMDTKDSQSVIDELKPLTANDRPLRFSAKEMMAYLYLSQNDLESARELFQELSNNPSTPAALKQRAAALSSIAPAAGDEQVLETKEDMGTEKNMEGGE